LILADENPTKSDHEVIEWEVDVDRQEVADYERVLRWNLAAMIEEDVEAAEQLLVELAKERAYLDPGITEDNVEQETEWCLDAISSVLYAMVEKIRICTKSKRW
jgi:hypothetical protein